MGSRLKRLIAFVIDWNVILFPFMLTFSLLITFMTTFLQKHSELGAFIFLLFFPLFGLPFGVVVLRDVIFKGRSLGKRILGLYVCEKEFFEQASVKQCVLRNVFMFMCYVDGIILLINGRTVGDRVAGTLVLSKKEIESYKNNTQSDSPVLKTKKPKSAIVIVAIVLGCIIGFIGLIQIALNAEKNTEEYRVAYSYLVESDAFQDLNVDESKIRLTQYSSYTYTSESNDAVSQTAELGFVVSFKSFQVVCHKENGIWKVCEKCTRFE